MSTRFQLLMAAAVLSVAFAANGSAAGVSLGNAPIVHELGRDRAAPVIGVQAEEGLLQGFVARGPERDGAYIAQTGVWSGIKNAAKSVGGKVKGAAKSAVNAAKTIKNGVKGAASKARDAGYAVVGGAKKAVGKAVNAVGSRVAKVPGISHARKLAQKVGTKIGKAIAKRL